MSESHETIFQSESAFLSEEMAAIDDVDDGGIRRGVITFVDVEKLERSKRSNNFEHKCRFSNILQTE
jgi:hypothetical protein